ncbi:hypothetical protein HZU77_014935 [Neisseriaceae bacterium TC5R-5]|nr:hypothetical protein [Neisseriaceae bacterium TC5R-5]
MSQLISDALPTPWAARKQHSGGGSEGAGQQWQRQLEAELGSNSICASITPSAQLPLSSSVSTARPATPPTVSAQQAPDAAQPSARALSTLAGAHAERDLATISQPGVIAAHRASAFAAYHAQQTVTPPINTVSSRASAQAAALAEQWLGQRLKPENLHIYSAEDGVHIWIRDAALSQEQAGQLLKTLSQQLRKRGQGLELVQLSLNGRPIWNKTAKETVWPQG